MTFRFRFRAYNILIEKVLHYHFTPLALFKVFCVRNRVDFKPKTIELPRKPAKYIATRLPAAKRRLSSCSQVVMIPLRTLSIPRILFRMSVYTQDSAMINVNVLASLKSAIKLFNVLREIAQCGAIVKIELEKELMRTVSFH